MTLQDMYRLSEKVQSLHKALPSLTAFHSFRFKHFVDSSDLGMNCRYAKATLNEFVANGEREVLKKALLSLKEECDKVLVLLEVV